MWGMQLGTQKTFLSKEEIIFQILFSPATMKEWNMLYFDIQSSGKSLSVFRNKILNFTHYKVNSFLYYLNPGGIKSIARLWLGISHL